MGRILLGLGPFFSKRPPFLWYQHILLKSDTILSAQVPKKIPNKTLRMSTQRGSNSRSRAQKHQNRSAFKNNLHDTSQRTKFINNIHISDVCERCKEIIEWKIKYKKYKPLTQPKKCVRCDGKTVKKAYHVMCTECGRKLGVCTKCCQAKEVIPNAPEQKEEIKLEGELQMLLQSLPERKRRTFIRYINRKSKDTQDSKSKEEIQGEMLQKLNELNVSDKNSSFDFSNSESDLENDDDCGEFKI